MAAEQAEADRLAAEQTAANQPSTTNKTPTTTPKTNSSTAQQQAGGTASNNTAASPEGDKPGYIYVPGVGYIFDEGGGENVTGSQNVEDMSGEKIGSMG